MEACWYALCCAMNLIPYLFSHCLSFTLFDTFALTNYSCLKLCFVLSFYLPLSIIFCVTEIWSFKYVYLQRYVADIGKSWPVLIVCGGILPLFLSVIWLLMIRHFVSAMPCVTVVLFNLLMVSVTMFFYLKG